MIVPSLRGDHVTFSLYCKIGLITKNINWNVKIA